MRKIVIALAVALGFTGAPALHAQQVMADTSRAGHHMAMMMQHHSVSAVDLLLAHRDSLQLTDEQVRKLGELRQHYAHAGGHAMHGMGMGEGGAMGQGMMMGQGQGQGMGMKSGMAMGQGMKMPSQRSRIAFDRVPGKSVPRIHKPPVHEHNPMCPMASLTPAQRQQAHQLLGHQPN